MRILLVRYGAWGDSIIITPLIRAIKKAGHELYMHTSEMGMQVLAGNPNIDKFIPYKTSSVPDHKLKSHWEDLAKKEGCDLMVNMCESIERALSFHPIDPMYSWTKSERAKIGDKNFYEYAFEHAKKQGLDVEPDGFHGELFFTDKEHDEMKCLFDQFLGKFVILWGLSGSGLNKAYPWVDNVIADVLRANKEVVFITTGDELCQALEQGEDERVIRKSGRWTVRQSSLACKYADLVVAPDTGLIHASGCFDTPKIGLIGSNSLNNITKHFVNDHSIQADSDIVPCAPCYRLIYQASMQCPIEEHTYLPRCMAVGIEPKKVLDEIERAISKKRSIAV